MSEGLRIAVIGATGAVGKDLLDALPESRLPIIEYRLIASRTNKDLEVEVDGKPVRVHLMPDDLSTSALLEGVHLIFFAAPPDVARKHAVEVADTGIATIEIGGALAGQVPLVVPSVSTRPLEAFVETRMVSSPAGPAVGLATVLAPLVRMGAVGCQGTVMMSAGLAGKAGSEELSQQVISLFSGGEPPRVVFPSGMAFDLNAQLGALTDGWTGVERRLAVETGRLVHLRPERIALTAVMVPLFVGIGLSLFVQMEPAPPLKEVEHFLSEADTLRLGDPVPGPRRLAGRPHVFVGRLRMDPLGRGVHLWAALDNLRAGATANAIRIAELLWEDGQL
ncbi:MAG: Asd/ArgC dimerization domain-containing protein [Myxococcota bacterium]